MIENLLVYAIGLLEAFQVKTAHDRKLLHCELLFRLFRAVALGTVEACE